MYIRFFTTSECNSLSFYLKYAFFIFFILKLFFVGVPHLATYIFVTFQIEPELGAGIYTGMAFTPCPSSILEETRFKPITLRSRVGFANH